MNQPVRPVTGDPSPFDVEWYRLHRTHELELSKATLQYELERLRLLSYLNGGAIGAFLAFGKDALQPNLLTILAVALWILGLIFAWIAWTNGYDGQRDYAMAYRVRRHILERERLDKNAKINRYGVERHKSEQPQKGELLSEEELDDKATIATGKGGSGMKSAWGIETFSMIFFALGAASALMSFVTTDKPEKPPAVVVECEKD